MGQGAVKEKDKKRIGKNPRKWGKCLGSFLRTNFVTTQWGVQFPPPPGYGTFYGRATNHQSVEFEPVSVVARGTPKQRTKTGRSSCAG